MDELEAVHRLLAQPPPSPEVVQAARAGLGRAGAMPRPDGPVVHLNGGRHMFGPQPPSRRRWWRGWLAPAAAAVAVTAAVAGTLTISSAIGRHHHAAKTTGNAAAAVARAGVPRYFVALTGGALPDQGQHAEVVATATGAVLGSVTAPRPYTVFTEVAAAGDDRTFVLAAQHGVPAGPRFPKLNGTGPAKLYKLVLHRSGKPGTLTALPVPPVTGNINGFALSPDGSKLAVSILPGPDPKQHSGVEVLSLASGDLRAWTLPGNSLIGWTKPFAGSLSWEGDNKTLLFLADIASSHAGAFLLDTGSGNNVPKRIPIPRQELSATIEKGEHVSGPMLITGDGTKIVAPTTTLISLGTSILTPKTAQYLQLHRQCGASVDGFTKQNGRFTAVHYINYRKTPNCLKLIQQRDRYFRRNIAPRADHLTPETSDITITEFSVKTGKPVLVLDRQATQDQGWTGVQWAGTTGTSLIVAVPGPPAGADHMALPVIGIQDGATFTPLPAAVQHAFLAEQIAW